jgi:hypothetical protein
MYGSDICHHLTYLAEEVLFDTRVVRSNYNLNPLAMFSPLAVDELRI